MKTIGITMNLSKHHAYSVACQLIDLLEKKNVPFYLEKEMAEQLKYHRAGIVLEEFPQKVDVVFVLGGDGTLLGVARQLAKYDLPILGINVGNLGFLSEAEPSDLSTAVDRILNGDYCIEKRLMLDAELIRDGKVIERDIAFNDIGIAKGSFSRMITCRVHMDGLYLGTYSGDGVIVSTPTGSTAYSLSCGGPIVWPGIHTILLTPICPHTLTSRPMVLPKDGILEVQVNATHNEMGLTIDGQVGYSLQSGDVIRIQGSACYTQLIKWKERSFFEVVRKKLHGENK
ncbi:NAD(+)/NADH kinase [Thermoflavimicrobium dichotomicum]|uniref:NAD kinase n=1 Tax=Thermoflavimicrobium dichotomicum TaxID=46223 RepID=A0A1I3QC93_9BACL|nr:NAD(+)/NADH kinase [Thermoflavimicrobium dichotomicum]SFJ30746.1 NAD+ kinase [Thermoflavimicrobium dichotomicum]